MRVLLFLLLTGCGSLDSKTVLGIARGACMMIGVNIELSCPPETQVCHE